MSTFYQVRFLNFQCWIINSWPNLNFNFLIILLLNFRGIFTWPIQDDRMNMTEPWQRQTLTIEHDQIKIGKPYETNKPKLYLWSPTNLRVLSCALLLVFSGLKSQPVWACEPGLGTCLSQPHQHIFGGKVNVCRRHEFWSSSFIKVHWCKDSSTKI